MKCRERCRKQIKNGGLGSTNVEPPPPNQNPKFRVGALSLFALTELIAEKLFKEISCICIPHKI